MRPCWRLTALAQMSVVSISTSKEVVMMLASRSLPMATTTRWNSGTPSCRRASASVLSAVTTWGSRLA
ncbi:hypothetical protein B0I31_1098 [Saccharothrix carnea]|uniref:Uncharacterized protein n=1 Tax=Saccharothrix carnea TaxID=1280637 RepID=A0A2P8I431_SACCR|nr:hypothetical protein B0I31_1098 [Saccharothrix carnea]